MNIDLFPSLLTAIDCSNSFVKSSPIFITVIPCVALIILRLTTTVVWSKEDSESQTRKVLLGSYSNEILHNHMFSSLNYT